MWKAVLIIIGFAAVAADDKQAKQSIVTADNAFALDLYEVLRTQDGNMVVSPFSATAALALTYMGARGNTATQMRTALHLPANEQRVADGYRALIDAFQSSDDELILRLANKVFTDERFDVKAGFEQTAEVSFRAAAEHVNFRLATEAARVTINKWVEQVTDGEITDLLAQGTVDACTVMVLVNAIYFKGAWSKPFDEDNTQLESFHLDATKRMDVKMMHQNDKFLYCGAVPGLPASAIEMSYKGRNVRLVIVLPNEITGLSDVESKVRQLNLAQLSQCMSLRQVDISLPKFTVESTLQLHEELPQLGIKDLFERDVANLTGITDEPLFVSKVIQKAFIEVSENGTIAAAATAVVHVTTQVVQQPQEPVTFTVDRPFLYLLLDENNTILFMGRTINP